MADDPRWPRASAWLAGEHGGDPAATLAVVGAPVKLGSISGGRFDLAPAAVRSALDRYSVWDGERDLRTLPVRDEGDLALADATPEAAHEPIRDAVATALEGSRATVLLGGDNSVTRSGVHGLAEHAGVGLDGVALLTLDAHHDLRDTDAGMLNGNPVRALLEDGLPGANVVQVGIQPFANSPDYAAVARDAGIRVIAVDEARDRGVARVIDEELRRLQGITDHLYVDLDVDVLDRAFAPACPGSRPGGLTPAEVRSAARICGEQGVGVLDLVEVDPERDIADVTVLATASFLLAFASGLARRGGRSRS